MNSLKQTNTQLLATVLLKKLTNNEVWLIETSPYNPWGESAQINQSVGIMGPQRSWAFSPKNDDWHEVKEGTLPDFIQESMFVAEVDGKELRAPLADVIIQAIQQEAAKEVGLRAALQAETLKKGRYAPVGSGYVVAPDYDQPLNFEVTPKEGTAVQDDISVEKHSKPPLLARLKMKWEKLQLLWFVLRNGLFVK